MDEHKRTFDIKDFTKKLPKVELHAHLNGSLSKSTIVKLYEMKQGSSATDTDIYSCVNTNQSLTECFKVFELIHNLTDNPSAIYTATEDVIMEFYDDGVRYLELRSTPKEIPGSMSRVSYVESMLAAIRNTCQNIPDMYVKVLLSVDRKNNSVLAAEETVKIAEAESKSSSPVIVGVDLSGDPMTPDVLKFIPVLQQAKKAGLKLSLHISEVPNKDEEVERLLELQPDRIGHGTFIHKDKGGTEKNFNQVQKLKIPLEVCLTSNVFSGTVTSYKDHHFPLWRSMNHPSVICTDDKGLFNTTLSEEYYLAHKHFTLTPEDLWNLSYDSIEYTFASQNEKQTLREMWNKQKDSLFDIISKDTEKKAKGSHS